MFYQQNYLVRFRKKIVVQDKMQRLAPFLKLSFLCCQGDT